jgi:putative acetyltransferase
VKVRPTTPADEAAVGSVVVDAFQGQNIVRLLDDLRSGPTWLGLSFVAERGGEVVGHVAYSRAWVDSPERLLDVLLLSPLSVRSDARGSGVGTELVTKSLALVRDRDEPLVFLEGSPDFYARFGFQPGGSLGFTAPSWRIPARAFQVLTLPSYQPWMTGALVYPDAFWRHDAVGP